MFALVDANSFYTACETVFRPDLRERPVVVLSNNDGCIIAANRRAKSLGDILYRPYYQLEKMLAEQGTAVFSSNYELYGDLSQRMHHLLGSFSTKQEIYSIDESFLDMGDMRHYNLNRFGQEIKRSVMKQLGLPVAVGMGKTRTLAKAANHLAKKITPLAGVLSISDMPENKQNQLLSRMPVANVWGVGRRWARRLNALGIETALHLKQCSPEYIRQQFNVVLERTVYELNGIACQELELIPADKQEIICSRSFNRPIRDYSDMQQAIARYTARAAEKLRQQQGQCKQLSVGIYTNPFKQHGAQYSCWKSISLIHPSHHSGHLIERAKHCLHKIWKQGYEYKKAFVMLSDISKAGTLQYDLFAQKPAYSNNDKTDALMEVLDKINTRMGRGSCRMASEGLDNQCSWPMQRHKQSPRYSTCWNELATAYIR